MRHPTEDDLLLDLIKTNQSTEGTTLSKKQHEKHGKYNPWQASNKFGSWNKAKARAGIYGEERKPKVTNKEILKDLKKCLNQVDKLTADKYRDIGNHSLTTLYSHFDSFSQAKQQAENL